MTLTSDLTAQKYPPLRLECHFSDNFVESPTQPWLGYSNTSLVGSNWYLKVNLTNGQSQVMQS
jgi:hypothetical protein